MPNQPDISLEEILSKVFNVNFPRQNQLARTFVRFQEYFENPVFKDKIFTLDEFKAWYMKNSPMAKKKAKFTYYGDWDGFNMPSTVFKPFYDGKFDPLSREEIQLLDVLEPKRDNDFYVLGTHGKVNIATLKHELSHALFFTNPEYRNGVLEVVKGMDPRDKSRIREFLSDVCNYHPDVWPDESQAYLLDRRCLGANGVSGKGLEIAGREIKAIFKRLYVPLSG